MNKLFDYLLRILLLVVGGFFIYLVISSMIDDFRIETPINNQIELEDDII